MELLGKVHNGNYDIYMFSDGTKVRKNNLDCFIPDKPESLDYKITNKCDKGCAFCLKPTAKLNIGDGTKEIADININDMVLSVDTANNTIQLKPVVKVYERSYSGELISITTEFGQTILCTPNHKIYTKNRGYVRADKLVEDDVLVVN